MDAFRKVSAGAGAGAWDITVCTDCMQAHVLSQFAFQSAALNHDIHIHI